MKGGRRRRVIRAGMGAVAAAVMLACWLPDPCAGHPAYVTEARAVIGADGSCRVTLQFDVLAYALNDTSARIGDEAMQALLNAPRAERERALRDAGARFERGFAIETDRGPATPVTVRFPSVEDISRWRKTAQPVLPVTVPVEITARLPAGTGTVAFRFPGLLAEVILTVERPGEDFFTEPVEGGKTSSVLAVRLNHDGNKN